MANLTILEALQLSLNATKKYVDDKVPHYNETLMFEISGEDYSSFTNNSYFNISALNIDETKSYVGEEMASNEKYNHKFVYDKEADTLMSEDSFICIYNHKSYDGENFIEDENSAVLKFDAVPMDISGVEGNGYFKLYEVEKLELDNNCLSDDVSIINSLTVGNRIGNVGKFSVAEGFENTASGVLSHAEGSGTIASNLASHAEGEGTTASSTASHAEGSGTIASGIASHAEGSGTIASGNYSHTEGSGTTASGDYSHAEGENTTASNYNAHAEGGSSNLICNAISDFSPSTSNDDILTAWNTNKFSLAKGNGSHVEGKDNLALGNYSHAEGNTTMASGYISHAEGSGTIASGEYSHAEGMETKAIGHKSHAEGYYSTALGECSHAEGFSNSTANKQITNLSTTTSNTTIINAWKRVKFSLAKSNYSHVEGDSCLALDECSHAEGNRTIASNSYCHSEGDSTKATGNTSHAEGYKTEAMGDYSHVEGYSTIASGENSHAEGYYTKASGQQQHVQGKYNIVDTSYAHIVGNGTSETSRSNAHTLDWNGNGWYQGKLSQDGTPTEDKDLVTKKYVDEKVAEANASGGYTHPDTHPASMITGLATVATSGSYNDLNDKPTIPDVSDKANISGQVFTGAIEAPTVIANTYFRTPALVGEGDNSAYYHRVNFGYQNHDYWEFHEYGGDYRFYENKNGTAAGGTMIANIKSTYSDFKGEVRENGTRVYSPNNKPTANDLGITIPSIDGLATETYVNNKVAGLIDSAPEALNTLNELATALGNDANFATTISNQIGLKANSADLATVATSGSYNDLSDKPTIPAAYTHPASHPASMITGLSAVATSGSYADLGNKPTIPTVTNDLTNALKSNYDTAYTHSQSAHAPSNAQKNSDITKAEIEAKLTGNITTHTHSQYLTSIPSEYITEQELTSKGYATESQINSAVEAAATTHEEVKTTVNQILGGAYIE